MRIDRLLVYLRLARTRSRAAALIDAGHLRLNGRHVHRISDEVRPGDTLVFPWGNAVRIIEVISLPTARGSAEIAQSHYRELDRAGDIAIATDTNSD